jgi:hypothetical protein
MEDVKQLVESIKKHVGFKKLAAYSISVRAGSGASIHPFQGSGRSQQL